MNIKKSYSFAFWTSTVIALASIITAFALAFIFNIPLDFRYIIAYSVIVYIFSFIIIQLRVNKFLYSRIEEVYKKIPFFKSRYSSKTETVTPDMKKFSRDMQKFAVYSNHQIETLNKRENYRREFLGNVSHELKTPLFTVQGYLLTLTDGGALEDKKISLKYLKRANKGVDRLISIVKDLDLISRLEADNLQLHTQPFDIIRLTQDIFDLLEMKAKRKNITLTFNKNYDYPVIVIADLERIEQVITNLVMNSIKYGKQDGETIISIDSIDKEKIKINVADNGVGLSKEHQKRIFERFFRVDKSRSRQQGGSGLGLSIVKHIIEAHKEQIFIESELNKGSVFSFTLEKYEKI